MSISTFEQQIYNCHLKHFRNGLAWKPRKDFSDLSESTLLYLQKLNLFFSKFKHISMEDFFSAPKELHPDEELPPLKYFTTRAAIKSYTLASKQKINQSPDKQIESIKKGFEFIALFCFERKIPLDKYTSFREESCGPIWLEHYRTHSINPYCLMEILDFSRIHEIANNAVWEPNLVDLFFAFRNRYHQSKEAKNLIKEGSKQIQNFLKQELQLTT